MSLSYGDGDLAGSVASLSVSASASTVGTPVQPSEYLRRRVFFLIDRTACKNEEDPPQDMILYFYPPELPMDLQLFLIGACSSMLEFARNFTKNTVRVLVLEQAKLAVKQFGPYVAVLSADVAVPNHAVLADLELVHGAFTFFYGSVDSVQRNTEGDHQYFLNFMKDLGNGIAPFIRPPRPPVHPAFDPLNYTAFPPGANRYFLMTSEVLTAVKSEQDNLGGCVILSEAPGQASVLCTHLEAATTSYILTRVQSMFAESRAGEASLGRTQPDGTPVFMPTAELARLRQGRTRVAQTSTDLREQLPDDYFTPTDDGEFVGLDILVLQRVALATIMNLPALYDERHRSKTKSLAQSKLMALEAKLAKLNRTMPARAIPEGSPLISAMAFDQTSRRLTMATLDSRPPLRDEKFLLATGSAHELFSTQPSLRTLTLADRDATLFARREFEQQVFYYKRVTPTAPGTPSSSARGQALYGRDMTGLEEIAKEAFPDLSLTML